MQRDDRSALSALNDDVRASLTNDDTSEFSAGQQAEQGATRHSV
jgi:hypothetical protein